MLLDIPLPENPGSVIVLGAGRSGGAAAARIAARWPDCSIKIADLRSTIDDNIPGEHFPATEAMDMLNDQLPGENPQCIVVPCIPVHAAHNWVLSHLGFCIPVPVTLMEDLPGAVAGSDGCIYSSLSDFTCPANCPEPGTLCPVSKQKRKMPLFQIMTSVNIPPYTTLTLRSAGLLPGVGGYTAGALFQLLQLVRNKKGRFLIATASKCHGVIHGFTH